MNRLPPIDGAKELLINEETYVSGNHYLQMRILYSKETQQFILHQFHGKKYFKKIRYHHNNIIL